MGARTGSGVSSGRLLVGVAASIALGLVALYVLAGGRDYRPRPVADPCSPPTVPTATDRLELAGEVTLDAVQRAACTLGVSRERLTLALLTPEAIGRLEQERRLAPSAVEKAIRAAAGQALTDASSTGTITGLELIVLREAVDAVPLDQVLDVIRGTSEPCRPTPWRTTASTRRVADQIAVRAIFHASCELGTPPEELVIALASDSDLNDFKRRQRLSDDAFLGVTRRALGGAVTDAEDGGAVTAVTAVALRFGIDNAPIGTLLSMLQGSGLG